MRIVLLFALAGAIAACSPGATTRSRTPAADESACDENGKQSKHSACRMRQGMGSAPGFSGGMGTEPAGSGSGSQTGVGSTSPGTKAEPPSSPGTRGEPPGREGPVEMPSGVGEPGARLDPTVDPRVGPGDFCPCLGS